MSRFVPATLALISATLLTAASTLAQDDAGFASPRLLKAGVELVGKGRHYPSPVMHDVDRDGLSDVVIGDLMGRVTWAKAIERGRFASEQKLLGADGKRLKFSNW